MALSLVCKDCNLQLRNVVEAQEHNELTGHTNFEESTDPVLALVCKECGKPCRSETEKDLHTKRTGHAEFEDKTLEAATSVNVENVPAASGPQPMDEDAAVIDLTEKGEAASVGDEDKEKGDAQTELVKPDINAELLKELEAMGFPTNRCIRALHFSGTSSVESAVNWMVEHEADADIDQPLLVPKLSQQKKLSAEEAKRKAAELVSRAKERREAAEREAERLREAERIRAGKEMAAAKRLEDELKLKRILEERQREKEEERRAKEKIRIKLEEDRKERRRKLGLPEELTEEEKQQERQRAAEKAAQEAKKKLPVKPISVAEGIRALLVGIKKSHPGEDERVKTCYTTLMKYCANVAAKPEEEKFRKIRLSNAAFQTRVGSLDGAIQVLEKVGFQRDDSGEFLELPLNKIDKSVLNMAGAELNNSLTNPFFGVL